MILIKMWIKIKTDVIKRKSSLATGKHIFYFASTKELLYSSVGSRRITLVADFAYSEM